VAAIRRDGQNVLDLAGIRMSAPLIGITTSELRNPKEHVNRPESEPPMRELALGLTYPQAVARAGAVPVVIPPFTSDESIAALLERVDGVCLAGGPDIHPSLYGEEPGPHLGPTEPELDGSEIALTRMALERELPMLCICRGLQALNVARGGTLIQDLPNHRQTEPGRLPTHRVHIEPGSLLAGAVGNTDIAVNSFHHQAVDALGDRLRPVAWAEDGLIEGIEATDREWTVGVQWHAEGLYDSVEQHALFDTFAAVCARPRKRSSRRRAA
jgi:putative glutamine amidotransferase